VVCWLDLVQNIATLDGMTLGGDAATIADAGTAKAASAKLSFFPTAEMLQGLRCKR
jgi:hypothetical protein